MDKKIRITCPVCERSDIERNIYPNCETDISLMRTLVELPKASSFSPKITLNYWLVVLTILFLILGIILGVLGTYSLARQNKLESNSVADLSPSPSNKPIAQQIESSSSKSCVDGFYYGIKIVYQRHQKCLGEFCKILIIFRVKK